MLRLSLVALFFLAGIVTCSAEPITTSGHVTAVTVYQGQALVTREIDLPAAGGLIELIVGDLPEQIVPGSLYAEPGAKGTVEVRSVRYRVRPLEDDSRSEVQEIDTAIQKAEDEQRAIVSQRKVLRARSKYLNHLEAFTAGTAKHELQQGVLDAAALKELTTLVFTQREEIAATELKLAIEGREIEERLDLLFREQDSLTTGSSRSAHEAVVFLNAEQGKAAKLRITYLVSGATWSPSYNLRADENRTEVMVEYNASVQQMSGEDWTDVAMTLSTATPSLVAKSPKLDPLWIRLAAARQSEGRRSKSKADLNRRQRMLATNRGNFGAVVKQKSRGPEDEEAFDDLFGGAGGGGGGGGGRGGGFGGIYANAPVSGLDRSLNELAGELQILDYADSSSAITQPAPGSTTEGISVVYRLENRTSLPSRSDRQLIQIARLPMKADFYRVATPVLTSYVYEEARLVNQSDRVLLAGPAATFLGDRFVGRGDVPLVAVGEAFTTGLGIDESLRVSRELVERDDRVQGGNRIVRFDYALKIESYGKNPATVRLFDRLPKTEGKAIKVTLVESDPTIVKEDADATRRKKAGLVRWDVEVPSRDGAAGTGTVNYTLEIEHDKNLSIVGLPAKG